MAAALALAGVLAAPLAASANTQQSGSLNCNGVLVLSSMKDNGTVSTHKHKLGVQVRENTYNHAANAWTYYNSGFTSVSQVLFVSNGTISNWGRSCDW
ncbi:hypothetical protein [Pseudolysinimonas sp.]|uniref:hypothetical protein n=1 Tax=Pseudolysinimonas sp. TaxID=2680009 RepID=UPI003784F863